MIIDSLFPVAILSYEVNQQLANYVESIFLEKIDSIPKSVNQYSDFFLKDKIFDLQKDVPDLYNIIIDCKNEYQRITGLETTEESFESWTQDYRDEGQYHNRHNHGINGISGIYWIRANEHASDLTFYNPNTVGPYAKYFKETAFSWDNKRYQAQKGTILIFPSYLDHGVDPSNNNTVRSTIAFNFPTKIG